MARSLRIIVVAVEEHRDVFDGYGRADAVQKELGDVVSRFHGAVELINEVHLTSSEIAQRLDNMLVGTGSLSMNSFHLLPSRRKSGY